MIVESALRIALGILALALLLTLGCGIDRVLLDPAGDDDDSTAQDDADGDGYAVDDGDCDDGDPAVHPGATELCNGVDDDCDGTAAGEEDADGDAFRLCHGDCDDDDATIHPWAAEVPYDGVDNDCSAGDLEDVDGDGYRWDGVGGEDCDDSDAAIHPAAHESPADGVDANCDGLDDPVLGFNCHDDDLTIQVPGTAGSWPLDVSDATDGPAGPDFYIDDIEFEALAGQQVVISLVDDYPWDMDPYLYLLGPDCLVIAEADDGGDNDDVQLLLDVPQDGIYTILVTTAEAGQTGQYSVETRL